MHAQLQSLKKKINLFYIDIIITIELRHKYCARTTYVAKTKKKAKNIIIYWRKKYLLQYKFTTGSEKLNTMVDELENINRKRIEIRDLVKF